MTATEFCLKTITFNMAPKLNFFFKFLLSLNPYRYQIDAYRAGYKTRDQEF